jgi:glucosamine--fructose-6-phosphate aminotransferase (isomerizing)
MSLHSEILEQPDRLEQLLQTQRATMKEIATAIHGRQVSFVFVAARGTSDNAARYANYLLGAINRLPVALAAPSLFTYYAKPPALKDALVVAISQSGVSPDIVSVVEEGRRQGCLTLAITNASQSPLAMAADLVLDVRAGPELSIAATKTYTAELMSIAMLSAALESDTGKVWEHLQGVSSWMREVLALEPGIGEAARRYGSIQRCAVLGRGYNYATAFEWALKLKELAYVGAEAYSSADFQHGPVAMVGPGFPVMVVLPAGPLADSMLTLVRHLKQSVRADLVVISNVAEALSLAAAGIRMSPEIPESLTPIVSIAAAQLFTYHLTLASGNDPEQPRTLSKVTETR